jgi:hypothetical protein
MFKKNVQPVDRRAQRKTVFAKGNNCTDAKFADTNSDRATQ